MRKLTIILFVSALYLTACNDATNEQGHDHSDGTHQHEQGGHEHGEGDQHDHKEHQQEDFKVGEDSTATEQDTLHEEAHKHPHEHMH